MFATIMSTVETKKARRTSATTRIVVAAYSAKSCAPRCEKLPTSGGYAVNPDIKLGDGAVCEWALAMSNYLMNPRFSVIDREDFAVLLDKHLGPLLETLSGLVRTTSD